MNLRCRRPLRSRRAFTVIELLVAISVTAVLVTLMVTITLNVLNAWNRSSGRLTANATARLVLDQISQDLSGAIMRRDGNVWLAATIQRDQNTDPSDAVMSAAANVRWSESKKPSGTTAAGSLLIDDSRIEELRFGKAGVWLRFITAQPDRNGIALEDASAPRAVSYQIIRRRLGTAAAPQYAYMMYRAEVRPYHSTSATSQDRSTFSIGYNLYTTVANGYNHNATQNEKDAANIRNPNVAQLIGNDVIDFGVRLYERDSTGTMREVFPVNRRDSVSAPTTAASAPIAFAASSNTVSPPTLTTWGTPGSTTYGFPNEAEVMVRVLTPEGVRLIQAFEEGNLQRPSGFSTDGEYWWDIAIKNSVVFSRRVAIQASSY